MSRKNDNGLKTEVKLTVSMTQSDKSCETVLKWITEYQMEVEVGVVTAYPQGFPGHWIVEFFRIFFDTRVTM
jgi:hypothetical protein